MGLIARSSKAFLCGPFQPMLERVHSVGDDLRRRLEQSIGQHRHVGDIRGKGLP